MTTEATETPTEPTTPAAPAEPADKLIDITVDGYTFKADIDVLDDIEVLELLDQIESQGKPGKIIDLLIRSVGQEGYDALKAHYVEAEGKMRISTLTKIYQALFEKFDPKG